VEPALVAPVSKPASVQVPELDAEHEACAAALSRLASERSAPALRAVLITFEEHFAHEEALLDAHVYQAALDPAKASGFSAAAGQRRSHFADHKRQLAAIREHLGLAGADGAVKASFIDKLMRDFETHAAAYDTTYAAPLSQALAASA